MKARVLRLAAALTIIAASLAAAALPARVATAAVINVPGDYPTIAAAVAAANPTGGDTIVVAPGTYNEHDITVDKSLTIQGAGQGVTIVDAQHNGRVFHILGDDTTVDMSGLTVQHGDIFSPDGDAFGAGVFNEGTLTLTSCTVTENEGSALSALHSAFGIGILNWGTLTLVNCTVSLNEARAVNGGSFAFGAGMCNGGTLTLTDCIVVDNQAYADSDRAWGAGIASAIRLKLTACVVNGNWATGYLGASGGGIDNSGTASLADCFIGDNVAYTGGEGYGGGLATWGGSLTLTNCTVDSNTSYSEYDEANGGGIENFEGTLTLNGSTVSYNVADGSYWGSGGGIENEAGTLSLTNCTVSGNEVWGYYSYTGGVDNWNPDLPQLAHAPGAAGTPPDLSAVQRRSSGLPSQIQLPADWGSREPPSSAELEAHSLASLHDPGADGGLQQRPAIATLTNCTVTQNQAQTYGGEAWPGGIWNNDTLTLTCTIDYGNTATDGPGDLVIAGQGVCTKVNSIVGDPDGDPNPLLGPLQDNGGPTFTHPLLEGSPAINTCLNCSVAKDQRGQPRAEGGLCDIGSYELEQRPPTVPALSLWGTAGLAVVLVCLVVWSLRRRLVSRKDAS